MMKMVVHKKLFLCLLMVSAPLWLYAQMDTVALIPFWGDDADIIGQFGEELYYGVDGMRDYTPWPVDMSPANLPPDVPEGGFPPYICPSPSLTRSAPYSLTGELAFDDEIYLWRLRLYLWQMEDGRLIFSDELNAYDREECGMNMPGMLDWLFSWIGSGVYYDGSNLGTPTMDTSGLSKVVYYEPTEPLKWLYVGAKAGLRVPILAPSSDSEASDHYNGFYGGGTASAHVNVMLFTALGIQIEPTYNMEIIEDLGTGIQHSFALSGLLRYSYRYGSKSFFVVAGAYMDFFFDENLTPAVLPPWGVTAGFGLGTRIGPGYLYLDIRGAMDIGETKTPAIDIKSDSGKWGPWEADAAWRRFAVSVCVGYEMGFLTK